MLRQWLIDEYGVDIGEVHESADGGALADAVVRALVRGGYDYDRQRAVLRSAAVQHQDYTFGEACLDRVERIAAFQRRLATMTVADAAAPRRRHSAVIARGDRPPAKPFADRRFTPAHPGKAEVADIMGDFCRRLVEQGYAENRADVERDLRQGFGYYRRGEDPLRRRRTVRWLHNQNEIRYIVRRMTEDAVPFCLADSGSNGRWMVAASLFADAEGLAYSNLNFNHGDLADGALRRALDAIIPRLPASLA